MYVYVESRQRQKLCQTFCYNNDKIKLTFGNFEKKKQKLKTQSGIYENDTVNLK